MLFLLTGLLVSFVILRITYLLKILQKCPTKSLIKRDDPVKTMICLGSGGHTTEMMEILKEINRSNYHPRIYVLANSDITSETKVEQFEDSNKDFEIIKISRSRNVRQSYLSSVFTTLYSIMNCVPILVRTQPELIICNGPGTCVPICFISFLLKLFFINRKSKIVFVESFCRVTTLSLSGKILIWITDLFVVQWPQIKTISGKIKYFGRLS